MRLERYPGKKGIAVLDSLRRQEPAGYFRPRLTCWTTRIRYSAVQIFAFPPCMEIVRRKVRRIHIGTHGKDVHKTLLKLFQRDGWKIVFDYDPNSKFECPLGNFSTHDGILTVRN